MSRLFIITPARDEAQNLPKLEASLKAQSVLVTEWIVLENGSTDDSCLLLDSIRPSGAIEALHITHENTDDPAYALGRKYARLIARGFDILRQRHEIRDEDFIGILDADSFPEPDYYQKLMAHMQASPRLGITSGLTADAAGRMSVHRRNWVRGSCRLWRGKCLNSITYPIGPSADTLSAIKVKMQGWEVEITPGALAEAREVGARVSHNYYGQSAYFRGETFVHCLLRTSKYLLALRPRTALQFFTGYMGDWICHAPRTEDQDILEYCRGAVPRLLSESLRLRTYP